MNVDHVDYFQLDQAKNQESSVEVIQNPEWSILSNIIKILEFTFVNASARLAWQEIYYLKLNISD